MFFRSATFLVGVCCVLRGKCDNSSSWNGADIFDIVSAANCTVPAGTQATVQSQSDADGYNACDTITGNMYINVQNSTDILSMDNINHITGDLSVVSPANASMSVLSMKSLASVGGQMIIGSCPKLEVVELNGLSSVGQLMRLYDLPDLTTVNFSSLTSVGTLDFKGLLSLERLSFDAGLRQVTGFVRDNGLGAQNTTNISSVSFYNTSITAISGLVFTEVASLDLHYNYQLQDVTLSLESLNCPVQCFLDQNPNLSLSLPNLTTIDCGDTFFEYIASLSIPVLSHINGTFGIGDNNRLTVFDAPSLVSISGGLTLGQGEISHINLPRLQTAHSIDIGDNPAIYSDNGIYFPNLVNVSGDFYIEGNSQPSCQVLDNMRCRGVINGRYYQCGSETVDISSDPNECQYTYPAYGWTRAKKLAVGLGVSFGILALAGLLFWAYWCYKKQSDRAKAAGNIELQDQLPKYSQRDDSDGGSAPPYAPSEEHDAARDVTHDGTRGDEEEIAPANGREPASEESEHGTVGSEHVTAEPEHGTAGSEHGIAESEHDIAALEPEVSKESVRGEEHAA